MTLIAGYREGAAGHSCARKAGISENHGYLANHEIIHWDHGDHENYDNKRIHSSLECGLDCEFGQTFVVAQNLVIPNQIMAGKYGISQGFCN